MKRPLKFFLAAVLVLHVILGIYFVSKYDINISSLHLDNLEVLNEERLIDSFDSSITCWETNINGEWQENKVVSLYSNYPRYCKIDNFCIKQEGHSRSIELFVTNNSRIQHEGLRSIPLTSVFAPPYVNPASIDNFVIYNVDDVTMNKKSFVISKRNLQSTFNFDTFDGSLSTISTIKYGSNIYHNIYEIYFRLFNMAEEQKLTLGEINNLHNYMIHPTVSAFIPNYNIIDYPRFKPGNLMKHWNPLTFEGTHKRACFKKAFVGNSATHSYEAFEDYQDYDFKSNKNAKQAHAKYSTSVLKSCGLKDATLNHTQHKRPQLLFIQRLTNRYVINQREIDLLLQKINQTGLIDVKKVAFENMDYCQQLLIVHEATILVGVTGAGLLHQIYMTKGSIIMPAYGFTNNEPLPRHWEVFCDLYDQVYMPIQSRDKQIYVDQRFANAKAHRHHVRIDPEQFVSLLVDAMTKGVHKNMNQANINKLIVDLKKIKL
ncbi:hypothetical protein AKO1_013966 [Acrasis kona]|uniref:Glycosyltransferase 61 catalytic domain-containing protein n=1 Tax=Acrasis kona TaxID=1008807 RepID=A0AAW2Z2X2_9EUKA